MSNVADPDILLGSVPRFLCCLSANGPTDRPVGTALQILNFLGLHGVTRPPFFPSDAISASIPFSRFPSHPCAQWPRPSCFRWSIATRVYPVGTFPFVELSRCWAPSQGPATFSFLFSGGGMDCVCYDICACTAFGFV